MKTSKKSQSSDPAQSERFIKAARELGCDESEERFDAVLKKVAKHRPNSSDQSGDQIAERSRASSAEPKSDP